jgi:hypothetical protein
MPVLVPNSVTRTDALLSGVAQPSLDEVVDEQLVLDAARRTGRVTAFGLEEEQSLASLSRDTVSESRADPAPGKEV